MKVAVPEMIAIEAADAPIGTPFADLDRLIREFAPLGVRDEWLRKEAPRFHLRLERYRIARDPIANAGFAIYLRAVGREIEAAALEATGRGDHPARMSFEDAGAYAAWLAREAGRDFRLPTEFEWEYAAAGPKALAYPWGPDWRDTLANTAEAGAGDTWPIGIAGGNVAWCGARDMAGNVEEWTASVYRPYPGGSPVRDGADPDGAPYRITRGGSFRQMRDCARCQRRHGAYDAEAVVGLRLAETG